MNRFKALPFALTLAALMANVAPASADAALNGSYTGAVNYIYDPYGLFGPVTMGESVAGTIRYSSPITPPNYVSPDFAYYDYSVTPGGGNQMTGSLGGLNLQATKDIVTQTYNQPDPDPNNSVIGDTFQFIDGDISSLTTAGLPSGYRLSNLGEDITLFSTDAARFDFPNLPSALLPLEDYDSPLTSGFFAVDISDANGKYLDTAFIGFQLTSVSSVPEPGSLALLLGVGVSGGMFALRRRAK